MGLFLIIKPALITTLYFNKLKMCFNTNQTRSHLGLIVKVQFNDQFGVNTFHLCSKAYDDNPY